MSDQGASFDMNEVLNRFFLLWVFFVKWGKVGVGLDRLDKIMVGSGVLIFFCKFCLIRRLQKSACIFAMFVHCGKVG